MHSAGLAYCVGCSLVMMSSTELSDVHAHPTPLFTQPTRMQEYQVGDAVLLTLPKCGTTGGDPVQAPRKPVARVVGVKKPFGKRTYQVRTNDGVLTESVAPRQLEPAPLRSAETLRFDGVDTKGVPNLSVHAARGKAALRCRCRGTKCGPKCACRKAGSKCTRWCRCKCGKGGNCGNCD